MNRFAAFAVIGLLMLLQPAAFAQTVQEAKQALEAGQAAAAADMLRRYVQHEPRDYEAWFLLGVAETRDKRYQRAISAFRRVIELQPKLAEPHDNLAAIYNQLDDVPSAVQELEQSLQKRPGRAATEENLGDLHLKLALAYYRRALERDKHPALAERYARLLQVRDPHAALATARPATVAPRPAPAQKPEVGAEHHAAKADKAVALPQKPAKKPAAAAQAVAVKAAKADVAKAPAAPGSKAVVAAAIEAWRKAWTARDMDGYFAAYADNYEPGDRFETLAAWKQYKRRVIGNKRFIKVAIENLRIDIDGLMARASFRQNFRSDTYKSDDNKVLTLKHEDQGWKIVREASK